MHACELSLTHWPRPPSSPTHAMGGRRGGGWSVKYVYARGFYFYFLAFVIKKIRSWFDFSIFLSACDSFLRSQVHLFIFSVCDFIFILRSQFYLLYLFIYFMHVYLFNIIFQRLLFFLFLAHILINISPLILFLAFMIILFSFLLVSTLVALFVLIIMKIVTFLNLHWW